MFEFYVNKLSSNYSKFQLNILINELNVTFGTLLNLPYHAHTFHLGPLINQLHLSKQLLEIVDFL